MSSIIVLSEELRAAHRGAHYQAATPKAMPLKVDVHSTDLAQLLRKRFAQSAALITAHNPASKKQTPAKNKKANAALLARIEALSLGWLPGHRKAFKEGDPVEEGFLVFGITGGQLEALMVEFDQEVALWCPSSGTPVLMLHPLARRTYSAADLAWEKAMKEAGRSAFVRPAAVKDDTPTAPGVTGKAKTPLAGKTSAKKTKAEANMPLSREPKPAATLPATTIPAEEPVAARKPRAPRQQKAPEALPIVKEPVTPEPIVTAEKPVRKTRVSKSEKAVSAVSAPAPVIEPVAPAKALKIPRKPKAPALPDIAPKEAPPLTIEPTPSVRRKKSQKV